MPLSSQGPGEIPSLGAARVQCELKEGAARLRVGILPEGRAPAREGTVITNADGASIGAVTSGGFGPSLNGPLAMGYVESAFSGVGTQVNLLVRGKALPANIAPMPFIATHYHKPGKEPSA